MTDRTEADAIIETAIASTTPQELDPTQVYSVTVPDGGTHRILDLEHYLTAPRRATGTYKPATVASFIDYATAHRDPERTTIWVDVIAHSILAILNDNAPTAPDWGDHRASLQLLQTPEWKHWMSRDGRYVNQEEFAEHLQDGIEQIRVPDGATMLEIAQTIQGKTKVDWKTARRLDNGEVSFSYQEEISAGAGRSGSLEIPPIIELAISPFYGEEPHDIQARLRYRIREGHLSIGYKLDRPVEVLTNVMGGIATRLREQNGFANVYMGAPRS
jgi:uncharacterized protein YfdQ (DUF2303 family)